MRVLRPVLLAFALLGAASASAEGFLRDNLFTLPQSAFQKSGKQPAQSVYLAPGADLRAYQKVIVETPLFLHRDAQGQWQLLQPNEQSRIAAYFQSRLAEEITKSGVTVTDQPGADVLRLRVAISGLGQVRPDKKIVDILPAKAAINLTKNVVGREPYLLKVGSMAQLENAETGEVLAGSVNQRETSKTKLKDEAITLEMVRGEIDKVSRNSARQLADALGVGQR
ncbi:DUF3313 domain-containing protein [Chitinilyticum piscinae]|uniref:DUF3313 domain-containing protein n=1 Tax=Chitinilyticum piscinae TaxID=2866724 RepID=A0A8J7K978_9NEIS|nr:DUF3313 domain-containing protein [Chitinilyticum piscinae]MBE9610813.1 DUF3313 domain-containing protein [Chitinilyticum piscinae]